MPHANFPKVTWIIFVKVDLIVMHAPCLYLPVLPVLADVALEVAHVTPKFSGLLQSGWHVCSVDERGWPLRSLVRYLFFAILNGHEQLEY